jgi:hypothetical protein
MAIGSTYPAATEERRGTRGCSRLQDAYSSERNVLILQVFSVFIL